MIVLENNSTVKKTINEYCTRVTRVNGRQAVEVQITATWKIDKLLGIVNVWDTIVYLDTGTYVDYRSRIWDGKQRVIVADKTYSIKDSREKRLQSSLDQRVFEYCKKIGGINIG